jgi:aspartate carbamoyltransferase catalytic subunit
VSIPGGIRHLLSVGDLSVSDVEQVMRLADSFAEVSSRPIPKVPALRGKTVATLFFEDSTRTRLSFEAAAKRLSADTMSFTASSSSLNKGESLRDTVETLTAMGVDAMVVRHASAGVPWQVARWTSAAIVNAGDGAHEHPTQALVDCYTLRETTMKQTGSDGGGCFLEGLRVAIVGDIRHSRVARSVSAAFTKLGAQVLFVAPATLLPRPLECKAGPKRAAGADGISCWGMPATWDLDDVLPEVDVVYLLRIQAERMGSACLPSLREYTSRWGLTAERARRMKQRALVMHPGPMVRGVEIAPEVADSARCLATRQVANGVVVRMAVLFFLLGAGSREQPGAIAKENGSSNQPGAIAKENGSSNQPGASAKENGVD